MKLLIQLKFSSRYIKPSPCFLPRKQPSGDTLSVHPHFGIGIYDVH